MTMNNWLGNENDPNNYKNAITDEPLQDETFDRENFNWNTELEERALSSEEMAKPFDNEMQEGALGAFFRLDLDGDNFLMQVDNIDCMNIESSQQPEGELLVQNEIVQSCDRKMEEDTMHVAYHKRDEQKPTLIGDESMDKEIFFRVLRELSCEFNSIEDEEGKRTFSKCCIDGAQQTFNKRIRFSSVHEGNGNIDEQEGQSCEFQDRSNSEDSRFIYECFDGGFNSITPFRKERNFEDLEANFRLNFGVDANPQDETALLDHKKHDVGGGNPSMDAELHSTIEVLLEKNRTKKKKKVASKERKKNYTTVSSIKTETVIQYVENFTNSDVLFGRGSLSNNHPGNAVYREFTRSVKDEYKDEKTTAKEKKWIVETVIEFIQSKNGRFLKYDKSERKWFIAEPTEIRKKVGQGIREN